MNLPERDLITLNIGGAKFVTRGVTLRTFPDTRLGKLTYKSADYDERYGWFYFDRSPIIFPYILDAYRTGTFHFPSHLCCAAVREEMSYWDLRVCDTLSMCCIGKYQAFEERSKAMEEICNASLFELKSKVKLERKANHSRGLHKWRYTLWYFLERPSSSKFAQIRALLHIALVFTNILVFAMMSSRDFNVPTQDLPHNVTLADFRNKTSLYRVIQQDEDGYALTPVLPLRVFSLVINLYFLLEFLIRLAIAFDKVNFFASVVTVCEVLCIIASAVFEWLLWYAAENNGLTPDLVIIHDVMALFFVLRLIVCFRLSRNYVKLGAIVLSLRSSVVELFLFSLLLFTAISFFGVLIFMCEWWADPRKFHTIPEAFWWAIITMSTVGFGDFVPITTAGYIVGSLCALCGIVLTGLAISILSHNLKVYSDYSLQRERASRLFSERCITSRVDPNRIAVRGRKTDQNACCHLQALNGLKRTENDISKAVFRDKANHTKPIAITTPFQEQTDVTMLSYDLRIGPSPLHKGAYIQPEYISPYNSQFENSFMDERKCPDGSTGESGQDNPAFSSDDQVLDPSTQITPQLEVSRI